MAVLSVYLINDVFPFFIFLLHRCHGLLGLDNVMEILEVSFKFPQQLFVLSSHSYFIYTSYRKVLFTGLSKISWSESKRLSFFFLFLSEIQPGYKGDILSVD